MENFSPESALLGGALIGLSAALLVLVNGRIAGISGIVGGLLTIPVADWAWRVAFIVGLIAAPAILSAAMTVDPITLDASTGLLIAGGVIVGVGTRLGGGCTSGHGVCGVARLSPRSITATGSFLAVAILVAYLARHAFGG